MEKTAQLVLILYARLRVNDTALVRDDGITADKHVVRDRLPENLHLQDIGNDLLRLAVDIGVDEGNVVVACDDVSERRKALLYALDRDGVGERVPEMLELLVRGRGGDKKAMAVAFHTEVSSEFAQACTEERTSC